jgi:PAS domain S-box-containing protein
VSSLEVRNFSLPIDDVPAGVWVTDRRGLVLAVNEVAADMLGYPRDELLSRSIGSFTHPDDLSSREVLERLAPGERLVARRRMRHAQGRYLLLEGTTRINAEGQLVTVVQDITALEEAERGLAATDEQLRLITDEVPALLSYMDTDFRYVRANATYREWFGIDVIGLSVREVAPQLGFWERVAPWLTRAMAGERVQFEINIEYPTGRRDVSISYTPDIARDGAVPRVRGVVVLVTDHTASKAAERALRDSERMLAQSQRLASVGTWELDLTQPATAPSLRWTEGCARIFGHDHAGSWQWGTWISPSLLFGAVHPDDLPRTTREVERSLREGTPAEIEHRIQRPDGEWRVLHQWALVERDGAGAAVRMLGACQDVTERRRAEGEVHEAREQLELVMATTPAMVARCDRSGRFVWVNRSYAARFGLEPSDLAGHDIREVLGEAGWATVEPYVARVLAGETFSYEMESPGEGRWIHAVYAPTWREGVPDGWVAVVADITERRELERALARSELRHRSLLETMASIVWSTDARGEFAAPQLAWQQYTGQPWQEHRGMGWTSAIHPEDREQVVEVWREAQRQVCPVHAEGRLWHAGSRQYRHFEVRAVPLTEDGQITEWIGTIVDVHEREEALQGLREAARRKDEFLAMLSHELRNPLAPIVHAVEILSRMDTDEGALAHYRDVINRQIHHFRRLLDDLLDVARVSQGRIQLRRERVELGAVLRQAVEMSLPLLKEKGHRLDQDVTTDLWVEGDGTRLVQVFANLLNNAAKYTEPGGLVFLGTRVEPGSPATVLVSVEDNGMGMGPELLQQAFDLFTQADRSPDRTQGGLGIGLTMVRSLVQMHGGQVRAHSGGPGRGSRFEVALPLLSAPPASASPRPPEPAAASTPNAKLQILIVEDNRDAAESLGALLGMMGHEVRLVHDGPSALATLTRQGALPPDLVLLDIGLPGMDGYEVASRARQAGVRAKLVALTGYGREEDLRRSGQAGFDRHLVKPVEIDALLGMVEDLARSQP